MAVDARDNRADRRQVDVVVGVDGRLVGRPERMRAMRTGSEGRRDDVIRVFGQGAGNIRTTTTALAGPIGAVGLLALRGGRAGVVGGLGRDLEPGLQRSHLLGQSRNLRRQCLDPCLLRQHQRNQVLFRERKKGIAGHPNDGSCPPLAVKQKVQAVSMQHQIEEGEQLLGTSRAQVDGAVARKPPRRKPLWDMPPLDDD